MKKFLRKKAEVAPDTTQISSPGKLSTDGTFYTPLYSRFASSQTTPELTPVISGPVPLSARVDVHALGHGKNEYVSPRQNHIMRNSSPASTNRSLHKPISIQDKSLPNPPSPAATRPPTPKLDVPLVGGDEYSLLLDYDKVVNQLLPERDAETSVTPSGSTSELSKPTHPSIHEDRSLPILSSSSLNSMQPSISQNQNRDIVPESVPPKTGEFGSRSGLGLATPPQSPGRDAPKKKYRPMAAFGLTPAPQVGQVSDTESNTTESSKTTLASFQPDPVKLRGSNISHQALGQRQSLQAMPSQRSTPHPVLPPELSSADPSVSIEFPDHQSIPAGSNTSRSRRESSPATFNNTSEPRPRRDSSGRTVPFGPRASLNRGPTSLVQGQPRIFAPMANPDQQDPPVLKPGQPRIFAITNPDSSPPESQGRQSNSSRYASPIPTGAPLPQDSHPEPGSWNPQTKPTHDKHHLAESPSNRSTVPHKLSVSNRYNPQSSPPHNSSTPNDHKLHSSRARKLSVERNPATNETKICSFPNTRGRSLDNPQFSSAGINPPSRTRPSHSKNGSFVTETKAENSNGIQHRHTQSQTLSATSEVISSILHHQSERLPQPRDIKGKKSEIPRQPFIQSSQSVDLSRGTQRNGLRQTTIIPDRSLKIRESANSEGPDEATNNQLSGGPTTSVPHTKRSQKSSPYTELKGNSHRSLKSVDLDRPVSVQNLSDQPNDTPTSKDPSSYEHSSVDITHTSEKNGYNNPTVQTESSIESSRPCSTEPLPEISYYPLERHLCKPYLLGCLLPYLTFYDWCVLYSVNKKLRTRLAHTIELKEEVLESYLRTIGYLRWMWDDPEPLTLSLRDLSEYMRGVSIPTHQYARISEAYLQSRSSSREDKALCVEQARSMSFAARAYSRVIIRLRLQAEAVARHGGTMGNVSNGGIATKSRPQQRGTVSRNSSRAPSPSSTQSHARSPYTSRPSSAGHVNGPLNGFSSRSTFTSPIYRPRRAPLLRVFVPSPEGEWLSDASVVECEAELNRAGISHLLRPGDAVWDTAVGDEGNAGRMIWDGSFLLDLDYTYSSAGDLPRYIPSLAFSPSYFHRVIRIAGNPVVYVDLGPWAEQIAMNLQLLQDRIKTETPQGNHHTVVRWVHRSHFEIHFQGGKKIPIPFGSGNWTIDRGWYGTVVVEAEGTNEGLADLQGRCKAAFPARVSARGQNSRAEERRRVFRILRERSKPGEIWIRTVSDKERLQP